MYRATARRLLSRHVEGPVARLLARARLSPNAVTLLGLAMSGGSAYLVSGGHFLAGGLVLLASGVFDLLDGMLARLTGRVSAFGALLDSLADRLSEAAVLLALLVFYLSPLSKTGVILVYLALVSSVLVSYLRARAEGLGIQCSVGIMTRPERVVILAAGLMIDQVLIALGIITALAFLTSAQRLVHIWRATR